MKNQAYEIDEEDQKCRIVIIVTKEEKKILKAIARDELRSMSSYVRYLINQDFDART
jgi:hypothetical protein